MQKIMARRMAALTIPLTISFISLTACQTATPKTAMYDFGVSPYAVAPPSTGTTIKAPLILTPLTAQGAVDGTGILYRLGYANPNQLLPYTQSRWTMPAAQLLHQRLQQYVGQSRAVLQPTQGVSVAAGTLRLHGEIEEFSHWFDAPATSKAMVRIVITLGRVQNGGKEEFVAQRRFTAERPAPSPDAAGGVAALTQASDAVIADIAQWVASY